MQLPPQDPHSTCERTSSPGTQPAREGKASPSHLTPEAPYRFDLSTRTQIERDMMKGMEQKLVTSTFSRVEQMANFSNYITRQDLTRFLCRYELFKRVLNLQGSIIECGCLFGGGVTTWAQLCSIFEPFNHQRRVIGFDSFEGFPGVVAEDAGESYSEARAGGLAVDAQAEIEACVALQDANRPVGHIPRVELVRGDACKTIPAWSDKNQHAIASLLWLDFDVWEPTSMALYEFVGKDGRRGIMPPGSIVAFDELNLSKWPGESLAYLEYMHRLGPLQRFPWGSTASWAEVR
jgi:hypothetical protein